MVVKLENRTLVVVGLADIAGVALAGHGGVNTVKGQHKHAHYTATRRHQTLHNEMYRCRCRY